MKYWLCLWGTAALLGAPKIVLFNDTSNTYHWGCTVDCNAVKEAIVQMGCELETVSILRNFYFNDVPPPELFDDEERFETFCKSNPSVAETLKNADAIVIAGEGTLHDLRPSPRSLLYIAYCSRKFLGKHTEIINHSVFPKDDPDLFGHVKPADYEEQKLVAEASYRKVYELLDYIAVREPRSFKVLEEMGVAGQLTFNTLPLYIRDHYNRAKESDDKVLVVGGSIAVTPEGAHIVCRYMEEMGQRGYRLKVLIGAQSHPALDDYQFIDHLEKHCQAEWELIEAASAEEWLDTINHATLLLSGRFLMSTAAYCLSTPFIALNSNTYKIHGLCEMLEQREPFLYSTVTCEELLERTEEILAAPVAEREGKLQELYEQAARNFEGLQNFCKAHSGGWCEIM